MFCRNLLRLQEGVSQAAKNEVVLDMDAELKTKADSQEIVRIEDMLQYDYMKSEEANSTKENFQMQFERMEEKLAECAGTTELGSLNESVKKMFEKQSEKVSMIRDC